MSLLSGSCDSHWQRGAETLSDWLCRWKELEVLIETVFGEFLNDQWSAFVFVI